MIALLLALLAPPAHACRPVLLHVDWILPEVGASSVPQDARLVIGLTGGGAASDMKVTLTDARGGEVAFKRAEWQDRSDTLLPGNQYIAVVPAKPLAAGAVYYLTVYASDGSVDTATKFTVARSLSDPPTTPGASFLGDSGVLTRGDTCATGTFRELTLCATAPAPTGLELVYTYQVRDASEALTDLVATTKAELAGDEAFQPAPYVAWDASSKPCFRTVHESAAGVRSEPSGLVCVGVDPVIGECPLLDGDGDGFSPPDDCDDADPAVHPGADETPYDGVDNDCDAATRDDDLDEDGFGVADDCDESRADVHPGADDAPYDGVDANCEGDDDFDADRDGHRSDAFGGDDCDDTDADVHPGAEDGPYDGKDSDCDGANDFDVDGDGFENDQYGGDDCDDEDPAIHPDAVDVPGDGIDQDCRGGDAVADTGTDEVPTDGCGCVTGAGGSAYGLFPLLALLRRRRGGSPSRLASATRVPLPWRAR